jgi:prepilin-type N-terminal cleavage/methylation domain-containing protein
MNNRGVTLIELLVVVAVGTILAIALGFSYVGWQGKYRVESQIKDIYDDLMDARARAMQRNRAYFVTLAAAQYSLYEDTDPAPEGDGLLDAANDNLIRQEHVEPGKPLVWNGDAEVEFTSRGLSNDNKTICIDSEDHADYNCIEISPTRINLGELTTKIPDGGVCDSANCVAK